ncbi:cupin domain-containing protein [Futiania mangrovi]|uniref:Cupin domain-containing protein n=1 Tax=Futiania mangrovi TaxID=2959716 RepID=A0A9J6P9M4_9PROT|nr:cupin domain-containing protein [Futiania mangrovii]MCP1336652.1 cupin domain-containing protein [Futiania mangrovii]
MALIEHLSALPAYAPPGHSGTRNVRLVEKDFCGSFEMILGRIEPGGIADTHAHDREHQVIYVISGLCDVTLGEEPARECGPGTVIRIPPKLMHTVHAKGDTALEIIVLYSPPLPPRADVALEGDAG